MKTHDYERYLCLSVCNSTELNRRLIRVDLYCALVVLKIIFYEKFRKCHVGQNVCKLKLHVFNNLIDYTINVYWKHWKDIVVIHVMG